MNIGHRTLFFLTTGLLLSAFDGIVQATPPAGQNWTLAWSDEFDGASLNTSLWSTGQKPWGTTDNGPCLITPEDTYLTNGMPGLTGGALVNRSRMGSFTGNNKTYDFSCGWAYSKTWLAYGYMEMRARFPVGKGQWPAWWMLRQGWPPEFDVAEFRGADGPSNDYMTQAVYDEAAQWNTTTLGGDYTDWRVYGFEWGPAYLKWYIDGVLTKTVNDPDIPTQPMYVILSGGLDSNADATTGFPNYFVIDYFRWYQVSVTNAPAAPVVQTPVTSSNKVTLNWTPVLGTTSYRIQRSDVSGGPYTLIGTTTGLNSSAYTDNNVVNWTPYYYVVSAVNAYGESPDSSEVTAMPTPPAVSTGDPVTASTEETGNPALNGNDGSFSTRWAASSDYYPQWWKVDLEQHYLQLRKVSINWYHAESRAYRYRIEVSDDDVTYTTVVDQTGNTTFGTTADTFTAAGRYVRVTITGANTGWAGFYECEVFGTDAVPSPVPAAPTGLAAVATNGFIFLDWDDTGEPDLDSYIVYRSTTSGSGYAPIAAGVTTSDYLDETALDCTTYYYVVTAVDTDANESPDSNEAWGDTTTLHPITVENPSFELPGTVKIQGWNGENGADIPGWSSDGAAVDSGVEPLGTTLGSWRGFLMGSDPAVWQMTSETIAPGKIYVLDADLWETYDATTAAISLFYTNDLGEKVELAMQAYAVGGHTSAAAVAGAVAYVVDSGPSEAIGRNLGIRIDNNANGWTGVDNVRLSYGICSATPDTNAPAAPTGLVATAGDTMVSLDWVDNSEADLAGYSVYRSMTSSNGYGLVAGGLTGSDYVDHTVTNGMTYYYAVTAVDLNSNESIVSREASARPVSSVPPPLAAELSGGELGIVWPVENTGWRLQSQTNTLAGGLGSNWFPVANSTLTNRMVVPVDPGNEGVFYRLVYPESGP